MKPPADSRRFEWTKPGAHPVATGVYRIPLPLPNDGLRAVNVFAIDDGDSLTLIDAGWALPGSLRALRSALATLGHRIDSIRTVLVTHVHRDHYTQAVVLRRHTGATVGLGEGEQPSLEYLATMTEPVPRSVADRLRRHGAAHLVSPFHRIHADERVDPAEWEKPDEWLVDGAVIELADRALEVIATPGHTRGHVVFHDRHHGLLFTGDHLLPTITPSVGFEPEPAALPLRNYLSSLERVTALPDSKLLPAHGPVAASSHGRVRELQEHHRARLAATKRALELGAMTACAVADVLPWTSRNRPFGELGVFNQALAVLETAAHLDLLAHRGEVESTSAAETIHYRPERS